MVFTAGEGGAPYVYFSNTAQVSGSEVAVTVGFGSVLAQLASEIAADVVQDIINLFTDQNFVVNCVEVTVTFPVNAANIIYDPAVGYDPPAAFGGPSGASSLAVSVFTTTVLALFACLLAF